VRARRHAVDETVDDASMTRKRLVVMAAGFTSVDDYIASFPPNVQEVLQEVRRTMHTAVPGSGEKISYDIPTITLDGRAVVYFAGWKRHVSVYPVPGGDDEYEARVAPYRSGAGTAKFPLNKPIPYDVIADIATRLSSERAAG
jgi:uncharacterized protein YdhG (YjbR/CyaY superfamily)